MPKQSNRPGREIAQAIIEQYQPKTVEDMQDALKEIFGPMFEAMLNGEMENHLGYRNKERGEKTGSNRRNGHSPKTLLTSMGEVPIEVPIVKQPLSRPLCPSTSGMCPPLRARSLPCTHAA